jgi:hypothetical protein
MLDGIFELFSAPRRDPRRSRDSSTTSTFRRRRSIPLTLSGTDLKDMNIRQQDRSIQRESRLLVRCDV